MTEAHGSPTIVSSFLRSLLIYLKSRGIESRNLVEQLGISRKMLDNPDEEVELSILDAVWERAAKLTHDLRIGLHLGEKHDPGAIGIGGYLLQSSKTLGEAVENVCRYHDLISDILKVTLELSSAGMKIEFRANPEAVKSYPFGTGQLLESAMAFTTKALPGLALTDISPLRVKFTFPPPADVKEYERVFNSKLFFKQEENALIYDAEVHTLQVTSHNPSLFALFENHANAMIKLLQKQATASSKVRAIMLNHVRDKNLSIEMVAAELFLTPRTLQRRLEEENTSYQTLLDDVRADLARSYLRDLGLSGFETAILLGFSESSAFVKSFRRWTGMSPTQFRAAHQIAPRRL
jgi:AraC-like DNA-binding protein